MKNIIICTTAIIRPEIHSVGIKNFYNKFSDILSEYTITHIINIDCPDVLLDKGYNLQDTINNFMSIIPHNVNTIILPSTQPSFVYAFTKIFDKCKEIGINYDDLVIWLEDDWDIRNNNCKNFKHILSIIQPNTCIQLSKSNFGSTQPSIMGGKYFLQYFVNDMPNNTDPEKQVRYKIYYDENTDKKINIWCVIFDIDSKTNGIRMLKNHIKYAINPIVNKNITINYYLLFIDILYSRYYYTKIEDSIQLTPIDYSEYQTIINSVSRNGFLLGDGPIFEDIGRDWSSRLKLVKWKPKTKKSEMTYIN